MSAGRKPYRSFSLFDRSEERDEERETDVLFVCTGNICRSALAEQLLRRRVPGLHVTSAGTGAVVGADLYKAERDYASRTGEVTRHRARQITPPIIAGSALVLTMTRTHRLDVVRMLPSAQTRTFTLQEFVRLLGPAAPPMPLEDLVRRAGTTRIDDENDDIEDPYGHSTATHETVSRRIDALIADLAGRIESAG